jgi:hypothetical protein
MLKCWGFFSDFSQIREILGKKVSEHKNKFGINKKNKQQTYPGTPVVINKYGKTYTLIILKRLLF